VIRPQDIVVLIELLRPSRPHTIRDFAEDLGWPHPGVQRALDRLNQAGLYDKTRKRAPAALAEEFLVHAVKYLAPARFGSQTRGVAAAWAARPLIDVLAPSDELPPVWPHPDGDVRGIALEPLHPTVPELAQNDADLYELFALVDAIRGGDARVRRIAEDMLVERLRRLG
jgi:hypothetical protein